MGLLDKLKASFGGISVDTARGQNLPRLAGWSAAQTVPSYDPKLKKMVSKPFHLELYDLAVERLRASERHVLSWKNCDVSTRGMSNLRPEFVRYCHFAYSAGIPLRDMAIQVSVYFDQLEQMGNAQKKLIASLRERFPDSDTQLEAQLGVENVARDYIQVIETLAWLVLLGAKKDQLSLFFLESGKPGQDLLFDALAVKLGFERAIGSEFLLARQYKELAEIIASPVESRPQIVQRYLKSWMRLHVNGKAMKLGDDDYTGYWAIETALVVALYGIDDSIFRDNVIYPNELVQYYRANHSQV
jgi:hypothetical protein